MDDGGGWNDRIRFNSSIKAAYSLQIHSYPRTHRRSNYATISGILLERQLGYQSFRPQQEDIIEHTLAGNDAVVLMPTVGARACVTP